MTYIVIDPPNQVPEEDIQFERRTFVWWRGAKKSYRCSEVSGPDLRTRIALSGGQSRSVYFSLWLALWRRDYGI